MDIEKIRSDFPALQQQFKGKPVVYFDNACMTMRPRQVIEAMNEYYEKYPGCAGRSIHKFGTMVTDKYAEARKTVAKFINARRPEEIVFTRNTTEAINLVANSFGLREGNVVVTSDREHNSNLLPWHMLAKKSIRQRIVRSTETEEFNMESFEKAAVGAKLVSVVHSSNIDGYTLPVKDIIKVSHRAGALVMLDAAQSVPHRHVDVRSLDADFIAFSGHKMLGPSGTGVLYGKQSLLEKMEPFIVGGDTVEKTTYDSHVFLKPPEKFEAGLQDYAGALGLAAAADYLREVGLHKIEAHEKQLASHIRGELQKIDGVELVGVRDSNLTGGVISFSMKGLSHHDIAMILDQTANVMIRSGQHCAHSWFHARGLAGSARASLYLYNTFEEAETFLAHVKEIAKLR